MAYRVKIMPRARRDLSAIYHWIGARSSDTARTWYLGLKDAIRSLHGTPNRCPVTPEDKGLRHLLYGHKPHVYRVIYRILEKQKQVEVLHIRHGAMDKFGSEDLARQG
jgi:plasmid stabilization system protein ParE